MKASAVIIILLFAFALGCTHKETVKPTETNKAETKATAASAAKTNASNEGKSTAASNNAGSGSSMDEKTAAALQDKLRDIHFDYNKSVIQAADKPVLKGLADTLKARKDLGVRVEGNCDERGTTEYNLALGDRRARAAKDYLVAQGVRSKRIKAASNGKEKPVCAEHNEECWARNRRDAFVLAEPKH